MEVIDNILYYIQQHFDRQLSLEVLAREAHSFLPEAARQETFRQYAQASPAGRVGKPEDVAQAIQLITGNTFITGQVLTVDGGLGL